MSDLFVGITTWNSAAFLPISLAALRRTTDERTTRLVVLDNQSTDATRDIARSGSRNLNRCRHVVMRVRRASFVRKRRNELSGIPFPHGRV